LQEAAPSPLRKRPPSVAAKRIRVAAGSMATAMTEKFVIPEEAAAKVADPSGGLKTPAPFVPPEIGADDVGSTAIERIAPTPSGPSETHVEGADAAIREAGMRNAAHTRKADPVLRKSGIVRLQPGDAASEFLSKSRGVGDAGLLSRR